MKFKRTKKRKQRLMDTFKDYPLMNGVGLVDLEGNASLNELCRINLERICPKCLRFNFFGTEKFCHNCGVETIMVKKFQFCDNGHYCSSFDKFCPKCGIELKEEVKYWQHGFTIEEVKENDQMRKL